MGLRTFEGLGSYLEGITFLSLKPPNATTKSRRPRERYPRGTSRCPQIHWRIPSSRAVLAVTGSVTATSMSTQGNSTLCSSQGSAAARGQWILHCVCVAIAGRHRERILSEEQELGSPMTLNYLLLQSHFMVSFVSEREPRGHIMVIFLWSVPLSAQVATLGGLHPLGRGRGVNLQPVCTGDKTILW